MGSDTAPESLLSLVASFGHTLLPVSRDIPSRTHGIYFIIKDGEVFYVGRSTNLATRVKESLSRSHCDTAFYVDLLPRDIYWNEKRYIRKLQPKFNRKHCKRRGGSGGSGRKRKYTVEDILKHMSETRPMRTMEIYRRVRLGLIGDE
jgi:ribosomal protein L24E